MSYFLFYYSDNMTEFCQEPKYLKTAKTNVIKFDIINTSYRTYDVVKYLFSLLTVSQICVMVDRFVIMLQSTKILAILTHRAIHRYVRLSIYVTLFNFPRCMTAISVHTWRCIFNLLNNLVHMETNKIRKKRLEAFKKLKI